MAFASRLAPERQRVRSSSHEAARSSGHGGGGGGYDGELMSETFAELYSPRPPRRRRRRRRRSEEAGGGEEEEEEEEGGDGGRRPYLPGWLVERAASLGYVRPTLLQRRALDVLLPTRSIHRDDDDDDDDDDDEFGSNDAVLHGQTGSGKTLAYLLPLLGSIDPSRSSTQAIIVVPTRELGHQVVRVARRLGAGVVGGGGGGPGVAASGEGEDAAGDDGDGDDGGDDDDGGGGGGGGIDNRRITIMSILQGSSNFSRQRAWARSDPPHVVIGTPEELTRMIVGGGIPRSNVQSVGMVVVDEVDACFSSSSSSSSNSGGGGGGWGGGGGGGW